VTNYIWTDGSGYIELALTDEDIKSVPRSGPADESIARMMSHDEDICARLNALNPEKVRAILKDYGAWSAAELSDHPANLTRILWLAIGDIQEEPELFIQ